MALKSVWSHLRVPFLLYLLTAVALLSSVIRLVLSVTLTPADMPTLDAINARYVAHALLAIAHVAPGLLFLLLGPLQFTPAIRRNWPRFHRVSGRVFIISGLVSGLTVLWLAFVLPAMGAMLALAGTWVFTLYMLVALVIAYRAIRARDVARHRAFMVRAYAIGAGVATIRLVGGIGQGFGLDLYTWFGVWLWVGMMINMVAAEMILAKRWPFAWGHKTLPMDGRA
jgi:uncharacterized membrane protein